MEVRTPKPNAEARISAKRLLVVLLDIDFLSLVVDETFPPTAGKD